MTHADSTAHPIAAPGWHTAWCGATAHSPLGFHHLVAPLIARGRLVRPVEQELVLEDTRHYLAYREDKADDSALQRFRSWFCSQIDAEPGSAGASVRL